jgi:hypothetical protein
VRGVGLCAEVGFSFLVPGCRGLSEVTSTSGEERLGRGLTEVCLSVRGGSASCAGVGPFVEVGF